MDDGDYSAAIAGKHRFKQCRVANVAIDMPITLDLALKTLAAPGCARFVSEENTLEYLPLLGHSTRGVWYFGLEQL